MKSPKDPEDSDRMEKARSIAANPEKYQVCCCCGSICGIGAVICPNCHGYRFEQRPHKVVEQAMKLGKREQQSVVSEDLT